MKSELPVAYLFGSHSWAAAKSADFASAEYAVFHTANDRYSGIKSPDRFFHFSGRCLYNDLEPLLHKVRYYHT